MLFSPHIDIALVAVVLSLLSQVMRRVLTDQKNIKKMQKGMKDKQAKIKELMKKEDAKSKKELERLQGEMMEGMALMMKGTNKLMLVSMVVFLPTFWFLGGVYGNFEFPLPVPLPWFGGEFFITLVSSTNFVGWYFVCSLVFSLVINGIINAIEKRKENE